VRTKGNLSISPLHPTNQVAELTKRKNEEIESIRSQSQQQILELQTNANQKIQAANKEKDDAINAIKTEYSSAHKTITELKNKNSSLKTQLETEKKSISTLKDELIKCNKTITNNESIKQKLDSKESELKKVNEILSNAKQSLTGLNGLAEILGVTSSQHPINQNYTSKSKWLDGLNKFHSLIDLIATLILMIALAFLLIKTTIPPEAENSKVRIDINELGINNKTMKLNQAYHVSIENASGGDWKSDDFNIDGNKVTPNKKGTCKIEYVIDGKVITSRKIKVKD
jgi:hypothetical protein